MHPSVNKIRLSNVIGGWIVVYRAIEASVDQPTVRSLPLRGRSWVLRRCSYQTYPRSESAAEGVICSVSLRLRTILFDHEARDRVTVLGAIEVQPLNPAL